MSTAVIDEPVAAEPRRIGHPQDRPILIAFGADLDDQVLIERYHRLRDRYKKPGMLPEAVLLLLADEQAERPPKKAKGK